VLPVPMAHTTADVLPNSDSDQNQASDAFGSSRIPTSLRMCPCEMDHSISDMAHATEQPGQWHI
jgi:hypothetical protein